MLQSTAKCESLLYLPSREHVISWMKQVTSTGVSQILGGFSLLGLPLNIGAILGNTNVLLGCERGTFPSLIDEY